jgi:hypothetical protein
MIMTITEVKHYNKFKDGTNLNFSECLFKT